MFKLTLIALFVCSSAFAGESGFIANGKTYTVYKDGEKVGKTAEELGFADTAKTPNRKTANLVADGAGIATAGNPPIYFQTDVNGTKCYYLSSDSHVLSCVQGK